MKKSVKKYILISVACGALAVASGLGVGFTKDVKASASTYYTGFAMTPGASVYIGNSSGEVDGSGIRFKTTLTKDAYKQIIDANPGYDVTFKTIVTTRPVVDFSALDISVVDDMATKIVEWDKNDFKAYFTDSVTSYTEFTTLFNIPNLEYTHIVAARSVAVLEKEGDFKYVYTEPVDTSRSMASVAADAIYDKVKGYDELYRYLNTETESGRSDTVVATSENTIEVAGVSGLTNPVVIIGSKQYSATQDGNKLTLAEGVIAGLETGKAYNLTVADANGAVFSKLYPATVIDTNAVIETKGNDKIELSQDLGSVTKAYYNGEDVFSSYENNILTLDKAKLPTASAKLGDNKEIKVVGENSAYILKADVYTKRITSPEELNLMFADDKDTRYAYKWDETGFRLNNTDGVLYTYDGYFVLGDDIDYENQSYNSVIEAVHFYNVGSDKINGKLEKMGFKGVFDGKGHTIENITFGSSQAVGAVYVSNNGLFGMIGDEGVVKNFALKNVHLTGNIASPVATTCSGTIDNVRIDITSIGAGTNSIRAGVSVNTIGARISNVFITRAKQSNDTDYSNWRGYVSCWDYSTFEKRRTSNRNVYIKDVNTNMAWVMSSYKQYGNPYYAGNVTRKALANFTSVIVYVWARGLTEIQFNGQPWYYVSNTNNGDPWKDFYLLNFKYSPSSWESLVFDDMTLWDMTGTYPEMKVNKN